MTVVWIGTGHAGWVGMVLGGHLAADGLSALGADHHPGKGIGKLVLLFHLRPHVVFLADLLRLLKERVVDQRGVAALVQIVVLHVLAMPVAGHHVAPLVQALGLLHVAALDFAQIDGVYEDIAHRRGVPLPAVPRGDLAVVQLIGDHFRALPPDVQLEHPPHSLRLRRVGLKGIPLLALQLHPLVAVWRDTAHVFPFAGGALTASDEASVDGLILPPAHEQAELEILLVKFVRWVVGLGGCDDLGVGELKDLTDVCLIRAVAAGQTLHIDNEHPGIDPGRDLFQHLLYLGPGGNRLAGHDLPIHLRNIESSVSRQSVQDLLVPFQRFLHTQIQIVTVKARFTEIFNILLHGGLLSVDIISNRPQPVKFSGVAIYRKRPQIIAAARKSFVVLRRALLPPCGACGLWSGSPSPAPRSRRCPQYNRRGSAPRRFRS